MGESDFIDVSAVLGPGCYALVLRGVPVYIGKAKRVLTRVYAHKSNYRRLRAGHGISAKPIYFTQVWVCPCKEADLDRVERALIAKYRPSENTNLLPRDRTLTLEASGFNFMTLGISNMQGQISGFERRF